MIVRKMKNCKKILSIVSFGFILLSVYLPYQPVSAILPIFPEEVIFSEDFEGTFPDDNDWTVVDLESINGEDFWGITDYRSNSGEYSGWCAQEGERMGWTQVFKEDFENGFGDEINGWSVGDDNPLETDAYWDDVNSTFGGESPHSGDYKGYCAGIGYTGSELTPSYVNEMGAFMSRRVNLSDYDAASITFYFEIISDDVPFDYGQLLIDDVEIVKYDNKITSWTFSVVDISAFVGDIIEVTWKFTSDSIFQDEGWYIDDIVIMGYISSDMPNSQLHNYDDNIEAIMVNTIDLSDYFSANLTYYYWLDCEQSFDKLYFQTSENGFVWNNERVYTGNSWGWKSDSIDLSDFVGSELFIRFLFFGDGINSFFEGAYIDDIIITGILHNDAMSGGDAGDDFDTATQIYQGTYEGYVAPFDIDDFYKIYVSAGNRIHVTMIPSEFMDFDLEFYDPSESLLEISSTGGDEPENITHTVIVSGNYFIHVQFISDKPSLFNYTLKILIDDQVPPNITIIQPLNGAEIKSSTVQVEWNGSDVDSGIDHYELSLDSGTWINLMTANTYNLTGLTDGDHQVRLKAFDQSGNPKLVSVNFVVNTSLLLGPGWMDDIAIFAVIIALISIIVAFLLLRGRGPPKFSSPPPTTVPPTPPS